MSMSAQDRAPSGWRATTATVTTVAVLILLTAGCATAPPLAGIRSSPTVQSTMDDQDGTTRVTPPLPATTSSATPADTATPEATATRWLMRYRSAAWTDDGPSAWIDRVRPYVSATMNAHNEAVRGAGGGTDWAQFVRRHCASTVVDTAAVVPPESPGTPTAANVLVLGTVRTTCSAGSPASPIEPTTATLLILKTAHGWRVHQRLF